MTIFGPREWLRGTTGGQRASTAQGWLDEKALADLVLDAVRAVDEKDLRPPAPAGPQQLALRPRGILAAMTFCYALGLLGSHDIEDRMRQDTGLRALCGMDFPDAHRLRRFRRENRPLLERTLAETFRTARSLKSRPGAPSERGQTPRLDPPASEGARAGAIAEGLDTQAQVRVERAMFIDQMMFDQ